MAKTTGINWCRSTRNFWTGCTKVSPGCDGCYAERFHAWVSGGRNWGPGAPRTPHMVGAAHDLRRWNRQAARERESGVSEPWRVFINSQSDIFDNEVPNHWREFAFQVMKECANLTFILVTKRIGNAKTMLPADWGRGYGNVILLITVVDQAEADRDIPKLLATHARRRGLSVEPMLGRIDLCEHFEMWWNAAMNCFESIGHQINYLHGQRRLDWVICGSESGPQRRHMELSWASDLARQCQAAGAAFFMKQIFDESGEVPFSQWPEDLRIMEFPE